jgi:hypothetical protein
LSDALLPGRCGLPCVVDDDCCALLDTRQKLQTACRTLCGDEPRCCADLFERSSCPGEFPGRVICASGSCQYRGCRQDSDCQAYFGPQFSCQLSDLSGATGIEGDMAGSCVEPCGTAGCPDGRACEGDDAASLTCGVALPDPGATDTTIDPSDFVRCDGDADCQRAVDDPVSLERRARIVGPLCKDWGTFSACVECVTNADCERSPKGPRCDLQKGSCACCEDAECPSPYECKSAGSGC